MALRLSLLPIALAVLLLAAGPAAASLERARAAQARGDLRAAQIELRNAVRSRPNDAALRAALAEASLDFGDGDTAEKEARAALERGYDQLEGTRLLLRAYMTLNRWRDLLRDFPRREEPAALGGQIAAAHAMAQLALGDRVAARQSAAEAVRLAPGTADPHLAQAAVIATDGDLAAAEAALDRALAAEPGNPVAMMRKAAMLFGRNEMTTVAEMLVPLLARVPGHMPARLLRAEAFLRLGRDADARAEVDAALRTQANSAPAIYLRGVLHSRAGDWRAADESFVALGGTLANFPDGFLFAAFAKRELGQLAQAEDLAQRYAARRPEDPRGAKLLATMAFTSNRPDAAAAALTRLADRGGADVETFDLLSRAHAAAGRPREALTALERAVALAPDNAGLLTRLAVARLSVGDSAGMAQAAERSLVVMPNQDGPREMLALAALARGDLKTAEETLTKLDPAARRSEVAGLLEGTLRFGRLDLPGARAAFEEVLRAYPETIGGRLGLVRVHLAQGEQAEAERLMGEVLRRDPDNGEALQRLTALAGPNSSRSAQARAILEAAQAAAPTATGPALALAAVVGAAGDMPRALQILEADPLKAAGRNVALSLARSQVHATLERWPEAEAAARTALAEEPSSVPARRQLAALLARGGNAQAAESLVREGLREQPADPTLQQALVAFVQQARGLDAALAVADQMARQPNAQPAARFLRGDLLLSQQRPADAAQAFATAQAEAPSVALAIRQATAWQSAGQPERALAVLQAWLQREPESIPVLEMLGQFDIQAGRRTEAERRLSLVVDRTPENAVALNNLAWLLGERGGAALPRARDLAERAYFLLPNTQTADTLGWILARQGEPQRAMPLLRAAAASTLATQAPDRGIVYRYAHVLRAAGQREEAQRVLAPILADATAFAERAEAERLLADLRAGR